MVYLLFVIRPDLLSLVLILKRLVILLFLNLFCLRCDMKQISCSVDVTEYSVFQKMFPQCLSAFIRRAIHLAVTDKKYFDLIFFSQGV